jgi:hypothetical protein
MRSGLPILSVSPCALDLCQRPPVNAALPALSVAERVLQESPR